MPNSLVERMKPGSVLVDVAIDQGGCFEGSVRPRTHTRPIRHSGRCFYCVANMPAAVPHTSTHALTNATLPYVLELAARGWRDAVEDDPSLRHGLTRARGGDALGGGGGGTAVRALPSTRAGGGGVGARVPGRSRVRGPAAGASRGGVRAVATAVERRMYRDTRGGERHTWRSSSRLPCWRARCSGGERPPPRRPRGWCWAAPR